MKFVDVLFCDDIRFEINNKLSLVGLYADKIVINSPQLKQITWPIIKKLSIFLRFLLEENEDLPSKFEFEIFLNEKSIVKLPGDFEIKRNLLTTNLAINMEGIPLEPGYLGFSIKMLHNKNELFFEKRMEAVKISHES